MSRLSSFSQSSTAKTYGLSSFGSEHFDSGDPTYESIGCLAIKAHLRSLISATREFVLLFSQAQLNIAPPTPTRHTSSFPSRTHEPQRLAPLAELNLWRTSVALQRQMGDFPHSPIRSKADQHARHTMPPFVHRRSTKDALDVSCCGGGWTGCEWTSFEVMEQNEGLDGLGRRGV